MNENKNRHTVWLTDETWNAVKEHYRKDNCSKQNEYIEKAIQFYSGYLDTLKKVRVDCIKNVKETHGEVDFDAAYKYQYSLRREDAVRLGYNSAESWRKLLRAHQTELAEAMKIPPNQFRWCAAFHDEKYHPHVHMMVWSADPKQGYLKKPLKAQVDTVVDELAKLPAVAECYEVWNWLRDELENYYKDKPRERLPLSQQKEFKAIKNMVIREAEQIQLGEITFEDAQMGDEVDEEEEVLPPRTPWQMVNAYREARYVLCDDDSTWAEQEEAVQVLEQLWNGGLTVAAHQLGKCWRDGLGVLPDDDKAELWFRRSAESGNNFSQYALGKLLQGQKRVAEAVEWYEQASAQGNQYADYRLGKLRLTGKEVPKDIETAVRHLTASAEAGNQYAQYTLGKLYLDRRDREQAHYWFTQSAAQGNEYAQFFLDRWDNLKPPSIMLSVTRLLHHMGEIFQDNSVPPQAPPGQQVDRKLRLKIREKKIAMGHKPDDHEEYTGPTMSM